MTIYDSYYVYAYLRKRDLTPYYIGKGSKNRINEKHRFVSVPKNKNLRVVLESNLTEVGALALERRYINWYGKKSDGTGILLNKTDGGDGFNTKHSIQTRKLMSEKQLGKKKRPRNKQHQDKLSCNAKNWEIIFPDGSSKIIKNINKFAKENNLYAEALRAVAYGLQNRKQHKGFRVRLLKP